MGVTLNKAVRDWRIALYEDGMSALAGPITEMIEKAVNYDDVALENAEKLLRREILEETSDPTCTDLPVIPYIGLTLDNIRSVRYYRGESAAMEGGMPSMVEMGRREERIRAVRESLASTAFSSVHENGFNPNQRNLNEITPLGSSEPFQVEPFNVGVRTVGSCLCDIIDAADDDAMDKAMIRFAQVTEAINKRYGVVEDDDDNYDDDAMEGVGAAVRHGVRSTRNAVRTGTRKVGNAARNASIAAKKVTDPMVQFISKSMEKIREADREERREIILKGGMVPKVMRWLKRGILLLIGGAVGTHIPTAALLTGITFIGWLITDDKLDEKERVSILSQLEDEIEIVNEKLDDSRGDMDKQKKYELMRIRNKLRRTRDKVKYRLKSIQTDDDLVKVGKSKNGFKGASNTGSKK